MADRSSSAIDRLSVDAVQTMRRARARLALPSGPGANPDARWQVVQSAADHLARRASDPSCPVALGAVLLDWRDRLGSHVLAARALADLDVHPDLAEQLLRRGLDEAIEESALRLSELRAKLLTSPTSG